MKHVFQTEWSFKLFAFDCNRIFFNTVTVRLYSIIEVSRTHSVVHCLHRAGHWGKM